ncbi:MAG: PKD domain-containing protein, partial [Planctomycetota bacterium]
MRIGTKCLRGFEVLAVVLTCLAVQAVFNLPACGDEIVAWGENNYGQATPPTGADFTAIAASGWYPIALKADGSIVGWGRDTWDEVTPPAGNDFVAIAASTHHYGALKSDNSIVAWGNYGMMQPPLVPPPAGSDFTAVAGSDGHHLLGLKTDGSIVAWGMNVFGAATPPPGNDFVAVAGGTWHTLALKTDGSIVGWGYNDDGQATPPPGNDFTAVAAGHYHSLALKADGSIVGWGGNVDWQGNWLGQATPPAGNDFIAIAAGNYHSLALKADGSIVSWGNNLDWQGNWLGQATPPAGNGFTAIAAAGYLSIALVLPNSPVNFPPVADAGGPYTGDEGSQITFNGTGSSDSDGDVLTYVWDSGDGTTGSSPTPVHIYADNGVYEVCLTVTDSGGASNAQCTTATISNVAPIVGAITEVPMDPIQVGMQISPIAEFEDPGMLDTHTAEWDWGDGIVEPVEVLQGAGFGIVGNPHEYAEAGICTVKLTVTDDDGGSGESQFQYVVVYDPEGGYVTGGGWIDSP